MAGWARDTPIMKDAYIFFGMCLIEDTNLNEASQGAFSRTRYHLITIN